MKNMNNQPVINVTHRYLPEITKEAIEAVESANAPSPSVFRFGSSLIRLRTLDGTTVLEHLSPDLLINLLAEVAIWKKEVKGVVKPSYPPDRVARNILAEQDWPVPVIKRVIHAPVFAEDGAFIDTNGYHSDAEVFMSLSRSLTIPTVSKDPTTSEVRNARSILLDLLLTDFPFVTDADRAHAMGAMLMPFVRPMISGPTPLHLINAPTKGTGKTLLAEAIVHPAAGKPGVSTEARSEEEWRKRVGALLASGPSVIWIDNVKHHLDSGALAAVLTEEWWVDRLLGRNDKTLRVPNTALWIATGNGVTLSDELTRRTIPIHLDAGVEHPYQRKTSEFRIPNLNAWMRNTRGLLIWSCATLIQRWIQDGQPNGSMTIGSFESWAQTIGGILGVAEIDGFLNNLHDFYATSDPETLGWEAFVAGWSTVHESKVMRPGELLPIYDSLDYDFLALGDKSDRLRATRLGNQLLSQRDRIFAGWKLTRVDVNQGGSRWRLQSTS